ncbi:MAG: hypothetical protein ACREX3_21405, partial [Gammaproteobacteria bacterium]
HRVLELRGKAWLQQVADYRGSAKTEGLRGPTGRVFPMGAGVIGVAATLGRAIVVRRERDFDRALAIAHFSRLRARTVRSGVQSIFALPFTTAQGTTTMVLFMDSFEKALFDEAPSDSGSRAESTRARIFSAGQGFCRYLDDLAADPGADFRFVDGDFVGQAVTPSQGSRLQRFESIEILPGPVPELQTVTILDVFYAERRAV